MNWRLGCFRRCLFLACGSGTFGKCQSVSMRLSVCVCGGEGCLSVLRLMYMCTTVYMCVYVGVFY